MNLQYSLELQRQNVLLQSNKRIMKQQNWERALEKLTQGASKNLSDGIIFSLSSLENFDDEQTMRSLVHVLLNAQGVLRPKECSILGSSRPIDDMDAVFSDFINYPLWETTNSRRVSGDLRLNYGKDCTYNVHWQKTTINPVFQLVNGYLMTPVIQKEPQLLPQFFEIVKQLIKIVKPVYGSIEYMMIEGWDTPRNLKVKLPDITAINIYGKPYVDFFGKDLIESAPFEQAEEITPNYYWLEANRSIFDPVSEEKKRSIREHFGEDAFMSEGRWRYENGRAPIFDFSKVIVDSQ